MPHIVEPVEETVEKEKTEEVSEGLTSDLFPNIADGISEPSVEELAAPREPKLLSLEELSERDKRDVAVFVTWPFVELTNNYTLVKDSIRDMDDTKKAMDDIDLKEMEPNSKSLAKMNILSHAKMGHTVNEFNARYQELRQDAERLESLFHTMTRHYAPYAKSVQFLSNSMVETCQLRFNEIDKSTHTNKDFLKRRMTNIIAAYGDRGQFEPIFTKLAYGNVLLDMVKEWKATKPDDVMAYLDKVFLTTFRDKRMAAFRKRLLELVAQANLMSNPDKETHVTDDMKVNAVFVAYWLARCYEKEFNSGKCAYVKTFIMNTYDTSEKSGMVFDVAGGVTLHALTVRVVYTLLSWVLRAHINGEPASTIRNLYKTKIYEPIMAEYKVMAEEARKLNPPPNLPADTTFQSLFPDVTLDSICEETDHIRKEKAGTMEDPGDPVEEETPEEKPAEEAPKEETPEEVDLPVAEAPTDKPKPAI